MSMGFRADPTNTSGVITVAGVDQVVVTNASNVVATTFTGALTGNASTATALSTATGVAPSYGARAWVNFEGTRDDTGAVSTANTNRLIRASGNVSSVLRNGTGEYTVNFTVAMPDANYAFVASSRNVAAGAIITQPLQDVVCTPSAIQFNCFRANTIVVADVEFASVVIFR